MAITWKKLAFEDDVILKSVLTTRGDTLFRNATVPARLAKGNLGDVLTQGANDPYWAAPAGGGASLTVAETEVFSGTSPTSWTDLDLSAVVGSNHALVVLKFQGGAGGGNEINMTSVRINGDTEEYYSTTIKGGIAQAFIERTTLHFGVMLVATDSSGVIEWRARYAKTDVTVDVIAFIA